MVQSHRIEDLVSFVETPNGVRVDPKPSIPEDWRPRLIAAVLARHPELATPSGGADVSGATLTATDTPGVVLLSDAGYANGIYDLRSTGGFSR